MQPVQPVLAVHISLVALPWGDDVVLAQALLRCLANRSFRFWFHRSGMFCAAVSSRALPLYFRPGRCLTVWSVIAVLHLLRSRRAEGMWEVVGDFHISCRGFFATRGLHRAGYGCVIDSCQSAPAVGRKTTERASRSNCGRPVTILAHDTHRITKNPPTPNIPLTALLTAHGLGSQSLQ